MKHRYSLALFALIFAAFTARANDAPDSAYFGAHGVKIHYVMQGSGEPVVLIHGWLSSADANWVKPGIFAELAKNHKVIALDLAGYGDSDSPDDRTAYGNGWVEQVVLLMDYLHTPKAHIVGYSMGGMVALKFIVLHPDRTISGLLGGMGYMPVGGKQQGVWTHMWRQKSSAAADLALTPEQVESVKVPMEIVIGSRDPVKEKYLAPLLNVRSDWPVVEVPDKGHIATVMDPHFRDDVEQWVDSKSAPAK